jgi:iron complex transport system substrate-binding protein
MQRRVKVSVATESLTPVRVFFMEWVDPLYCGGHWVPEMLQWAGGKDPLSKRNMDSVRIAWEDVLQQNPEVLVVSPCGYALKDSLKQAELLKSRPGWRNLKAVQKGRVFAVDGNSYFARPSLRLADGVELLAHLFHPEMFTWKGPTNAFAKVS